MANFGDVLWLVPVVIAGYAYLQWLNGMRSEAVDKQRALIREAFLRRVVSSNNAQFSFDPTTAHLVHERETIQGENAVLVQLEALYRNPHGEYFLFLCSAGDKGFLKHLPREAAKRFLKAFPAAHEQEFGTASGPSR